MKDDRLYNAIAGLPDDFREGMEEYFTSSPGTAVWKLQNFAKYVPRQILARFLLRTEIFKKILHLQGSVVECGVLAGGSLMTWAQLSAIYEPLHLLRKIIGFDTFEGFPSVSERDKKENPFVYVGSLKLEGTYEDIKKAIELYDKNRLLKTPLTKVDLVKGDINETVPLYLEKNPHLVVSLLYLDVDLYEPTKIAIKHFLPRMTKGAVIVFDELNDESWPGETQAVCEEIGLNNLKIERFTYDTSISYAVLS